LINRIASCIYSFIELNLTVLTLTQTFLTFLAVKNHAAVTLNYQSKIVLPLG